MVLFWESSHMFWSISFPQTFLTEPHSSTALLFSPDSNGHFIVVVICLLPSDRTLLHWPGWLETHGHPASAFYAPSHPVQGILKTE